MEAMYHIIHPYYGTKQALVDIVYDQVTVDGWVGDIASRKRALEKCRQHLDPRDWKQVVFYLNRNASNKFPAELIAYANVLAQDGDGNVGTQQHIGCDTVPPPSAPGL